jgi:transposase
MEETGRYAGLGLGKRACTMAVAGERGAAMSNGTTTAAGCRVYALNPHHLAVICRPMKKTGKEGALKPARLLEDTREGRLPVVPVPSGREMKRRKLVAAYRREQGNRTRAINRLRALLMSRGITAAVKKGLAEAAGRAGMAQALDGLEREEADYLADCLGLYEKRLEYLEGQMDEEAAGDGEIERLQTVPGVGPKAAFTFAAHAAAARRLGVLLYTLDEEQVNRGISGSLNRRGKNWPSWR